LAGLGLAQQQTYPPSNSTPPTFPQGQTPRHQMPPDQEAPPNDELSSAQVEQQIQRGLNSEPKLENTNVSAKTDDRSVVLTGTVNTEKQHDVAMRIARSYAGKREIVDNIKLK
jgi:osmotically-inducible protein OsmY